MVTLVGTQSNFISALKDLLELEYDALETYEAVINRIDSDEYKKTLKVFKDQHEKHIKDLSDFLTKKGEEIAHGPSGKQVYNIGKVAIGNLLGDKAILRALKGAEEDMNTAYERLTKHEQRLKEVEDLLNRNLADERKHLEWVKSSIEKD